jgi:hypothetical protein
MRAAVKNPDSEFMEIDATQQSRSRAVNENVRVGLA